MKVTGKITKVLIPKTGTSKSGKDWIKQSFILTTTDEYNNLYCFEVFGTEKVENFNKYNKVNDEVTVEFNVSCNEWEGKYFTSLQSWKINKTNQEPVSAELNKSQTDDDLPF